MFETRAGGSAQSTTAGHRQVGYALRTVAFAQGNRARQGTRAIGAGACAAHDINGLKAFGRDLTPDDPAAKGIIDRHSIQRHQGATGSCGGNGAKRQALGGRVGRQTVCAPEKGNGWDLAQSLIYSRRGGQILAMERSIVKSELGYRRAQTGSCDNDVCEAGEFRRRRLRWLGDIKQHANTPSNPGSVTIDLVSLKEEPR